MTIDYYQHDDIYLATTGKHPSGFKGVLQIVFTGPSVDQVTEQVISVLVLDGLDQVADVPADWEAAFETLGCISTPQKRVRKRSEYPNHARPPRRAGKRQEFFDHLSAGTDVATAVAASGYDFEEVETTTGMTVKEKEEALVGFTYLILGSILIPIVWSLFT